MKKYIRPFVLGFAALLAFNFNGCILDAFDTLTQGFPVSQEVTISDPTGLLTSFQNSSTINLDDSDFYSENQDKIKKIELVKIAYRTKNVTPANMEGDIVITVKQSNNTVLFSKSIPNASPADYINTPYELQLTQSEIQLVNAYIGILSNKTFTATIEVNNVTPSGPKTLTAVIDVVFEMEYDL